MSMDVLLSLRVQLLEDCCSYTSRRLLLPASTAMTYNAAKTLGESWSDVYSVYDLRNKLTDWREIAIVTGCNEIYQNL
jgi:hypothetical protein